jgi:hypothetical protein
MEDGTGTSKAEEEQVDIETASATVRQVSKPD